MMKKIGLYVFFMAFCNFSVAGLTPSNLCEKHDGIFIEDVKVLKLSGFTKVKSSKGQAYIDGEFMKGMAPGYYTVDHKAPTLFELAENAYITKTLVDVCIRHHGALIGDREIFAITMK